MEQIIRRKLIQAKNQNQMKLTNTGLLRSNKTTFDWATTAQMPRQKASITKLISVLHETQK